MPLGGSWIQLPLIETVAREAWITRDTQYVSSTSLSSSEPSLVRWVTLVIWEKLGRASDRHIPREFVANRCWEAGSGEQWRIGLDDESPSVVSSAASLKSNLSNLRAQPNDRHRPVRSVGLAGSGKQVFGMNLSTRHLRNRTVDRWLSVASIAVLLCAGCSGRSVTADNPVVGMIPPRMAVVDDSPEIARSQDASTSVTPVSHDDAIERASLDSEMAEIAAVVNGTPILVADVLEKYSMQLAQVKQQATKEQYAELREQLIRRELPHAIDEAVLMDAAIMKLGADQKEQLERQLDNLFTQKLEEIKQQLEVGTLAELEAKMQQQGTTLSNLRRSFGRQSLAAQSMQLHMPPEPNIARSELLTEYEKRIDEYKSPAQVKWQQIWISYDKNGGKTKALTVLDSAIAELKNGTDFSTVARKYSNGVMANDGGNWDWTQKGSLANEEVERMLFELNVGEIGPVISDKQAYQIVRVTERRPDRVKPFEEVQNDIRAELIAEKQQGVSEEVIRKLKKTAVITTMFDAG